MDFFVENINQPKEVCQKGPKKLKGGDKQMALASTRFWIVLAAIVASFALLVGTAFAKPNDNGTRPGWGLGDDNHVHTGPPGRSPNATPPPGAAHGNKAT